MERQPAQGQEPAATQVELDEARKARQVRKVHVAEATPFKIRGLKLANRMRYVMPASLFDQRHCQAAHVQPLERAPAWQRDDFSSQATQDTIA